MSVDHVKRRSIGGFSVVDTRADDLIDTLRRRLDDGRATELLFANTNFIVSCRSMAEQLRGPETLIVNDGIGLDLASWLVHQRFFAENLNGTDFVPRLFDRLDRPTRIFLLGASPDSLQGAARAFAAFPEVTVVGSTNGYEDLADNDAVIDAIVRHAPDVLLVALGDPKQAQWIVSNRHKHRVPLVIAVGAFFDFVSGTMPRAPTLMRRARLEWLFRLALEPRRLLMRYSVDLVRFFAHCVRTHRHERNSARIVAGRSS